MFSKACEYAIKAMIFIAQCHEKNKLISFKETAAAIDSPVAFTAKIMQKLSREGLLNSSKGAAGGFELTAAPGMITLAQIVIAIDGDQIFTGCGLGLDKCNALKPCPVHDKFAVVRDQLAQMLYSNNLLELSKEVNNGISFLTRQIFSEIKGQYCLT